TEYLVVAPQEPALGGFPGGQRQRGLFALPAPRIRTGRVRFVAPEETHRASAIDRVRDVGANQADAQATVLRAGDLVHRWASHGIKPARRPGLRGPLAAA